MHSFPKRRAELVFVRKSKLEAVCPAGVPGDEQRVYTDFLELPLQNGKRFHRQPVVLSKRGDKAVAAVRAEPERIAGEQIFIVNEVDHVPQV